MTPLLDAIHALQTVPFAINLPKPKRRGRTRWPLCSGSTAGKVSPAEEIGTAS
jgi:hypothetical protein